MTDYHNECDDYPTYWIESLDDKKLNRFILYLDEWIKQCEEDGCHLLKKYAISKKEEAVGIKDNRK